MDTVERYVALKANYLAKANAIRSLGSSLSKLSAAMESDWFLADPAGTKAPFKPSRVAPFKFDPSVWPTAKTVTEQFAEVASAWAEFNAFYDSLSEAHRSVLAAPASVHIGWLQQAPNR